jgi:hypothetical protein
MRMGTTFRAEREARNVGIAPLEIRFPGFHSVPEDCVVLWTFAKLGQMPIQASPVLSSFANAY